MKTFALSPFGFALALSIAAVGSADPATAAQAAPFDAERIVNRINQPDLGVLVRNNGDTVVSEGQQGAVSILAQTPEGLYYNIIGTACDLPDYGKGCLGVTFQVRYDADETVTPENINLANLTYLAVKVMRGANQDGEDTLFVIHYAILDGGQKMGNLDTILDNVLSLGPKVAEIVWPAPA